MDRFVQMSFRRSGFALSLITVLAGALACRSPAPVAPPQPPPPVAKAEPPPPPPPPPKCESLEEKCQATADTEVDLSDAALRFAPPAGWLYAREPGVSIAMAPGSTATLALTAAPSGDRAPVLEAVQKLLTRLEIEDVNTRSLRGRLGKADGELESGAIAIQLWEVDKRRQHGKAPQLKGKGQGTLLVAVAKGQDGKVVVGTGFVVMPDTESMASVIMKSIQSLKAAP